MLICVCVTSEQGQEKEVTSPLGGGPQKYWAKHFALLALLASALTEWHYI